MKIRLICFLLIFSFTLVILSACDNTPEDTSSQTSSEITSEEISDTSSEPENMVSEVSFDFRCFEDMTVWENYDEIFNIECAKKTENGETLFVVKNKEDLETFVSKFKYSSMEVVKSFENLSDDYFEEKTVLISIFATPTEGYEYDLISAVVEDDTLKLDYSYRMTQEAVDLVLTKYYCVVEVEKDEIDGCEKYVVESEFNSTSRELEFIEHTLWFAKILDPKYDEYVNYFEKNKDKEKVTYVLTSVEEVEEFSTILRSPYDLVSEIPDGYFDEKVLIVNNFVANNMSDDEIFVEKVCANENGIRVYYGLKKGVADFGLPAEDSILHFVEINKSDVLGCESFTAEFVYPN